MSFLMTYLKQISRENSCLTISTRDIPTRTENAPIVGRISIHTLEDLKSRRSNEVAFLLAKLTLEKYFRQDGSLLPKHSKTHKFDNSVKMWLSPQVLEIAKQWLLQCVVLEDNTFVQLLLLIELAHDASDKIYQAIVKANQESSILVPILSPYDAQG